MSADQMTCAERIDYHANRVLEAVRQSSDPQVRAFGDGLVILDVLAFDHAREAAHFALHGRCNGRCI